MNEQIKRDNISLLHRTDGDGMEQEKQINDTSNVKKIKIIKHSIKHFKQINLNELNLKYLKPKLIKLNNNTNINKYNNKSVVYNKFKETSVRFIPKEPFKGAVTPLTVNYYLKQQQQQQQQHSIKKYKKNNIDIQVLVSQMCNLATAELKIKDNNIKVDNDDNNKNKKIILNSNSNCLTTNRDSADSNSLLLNEIKELKNKNELLEEQLRFQIKVNGELKTLLVASLGEDLEARVQDLTNDKLELARALLSSTEHLTSHREQLEYLAGHSEVWRSKFLASSLMVDELAKYKLELTTLINELKECIKLLLQESNDITLLINNIYYLLLKIINKLNINNNNNITTNHFNIIDLLNHIQTLITTIGLHLFKNNFNTTTTTTIQQQQQIQTNVVNINTNAEIKSQQVLIKTNKILQQDGGTSDGNSSGSNNTTTTTTNTTDHTNTMIYQLLINNKIKQQQQQQINTQCCIHCNHNK